MVVYYWKWRDIYIFSNNYASGILSPWVTIAMQIDAHLNVSNRSRSLRTISKSMQIRVPTYTRAIQISLASRHRSDGLYCKYTSWFAFKYVPQNWDWTTTLHQNVFQQHTSTSHRPRKRNQRGTHISSNILLVIFRHRKIFSRGGWTCIYLLSWLPCCWGDYVNTPLCQRARDFSTFRDYLTQ